MSSVTDTGRTARTRAVAAYRMPDLAISLLPPILSAVLVLAVWEGFVRLNDVPAYLLPAPTLILTVLIERFDLLMRQLGFTAMASALGFVIALVSGIAVGAAISASRIFDRAVYPWLVISHAIPKVVIAPLFLVWFGFGMTSEVLFVVVFTFFPIVVNTVAGLKSADPEMLQLARSMTASPLQSLWKIKIPGALPTIFAGIKISITMAPVGAVIGEFVASNVGLGHVLIQAVGSLETPLAFAAVVVISIFGIAIWYAAEAIERLSIPWHASQRTASTH
ncbi:ABC transporter permease [Aquibium sp. A9E412]|uniref:ABC transporter permease n=1 Tax=Aquibium sp. A9E412 TaxID=2976767 RepID=UPI0025B0565F|nr:ABC transporter permease [Aquibium sp. A9E412]MDN2566399.1 ABC transporter permease [Aquibium sp. A9E412]